MKAPESICLHAGQDVELLYSPGQQGAYACVAFASYVNSGRPRPFGSTFFFSEGIAAYYVVPTWNNWYQSPDMEQIAERIRDHARGRPLFGYGSSMGGFGALAYANRLGLQRVLALSPQVALSNALVGGFERRWRRDAAVVPDYWPDARAGLTDQIEGLIAYDPIHRGDRLHAEMILKAAGSRLGVVSVPCAGHPVSFALAADSVLSRLVRRLVAGESVESVARDTRHAYRTSSARARFTVGRFVDRRRRQGIHSPMGEALVATYGYVRTPQRKQAGKARRAATPPQVDLELSAALQEVRTLMGKDNPRAALRSVRLLLQRWPTENEARRLLRQIRARVRPDGKTGQAQTAASHPAGSAAD